jgi:hypothetical protein
MWSEKLPFAGYSVVKDHSGGIRPSELLSAVLGTTSPGPPSLTHSWGPDAPLRSFARIQSLRLLAFAPARSLRGAPTPHSAPSPLAPARTSRRLRCENDELFKDQRPLVVALQRTGGFRAQRADYRCHRLTLAGAGPWGPRVGRRASIARLKTKWRIPGSNR